MGEENPHIQFQQAVLVPAYRLRELELQNALAVRIPARLTNSLIKFLSTSLPVTDLKHLKRVRKAHGANSGDQIEVLLCKTHSSADGGINTCNDGSVQGPGRPEAAGVAEPIGLNGATEPARGGPPATAAGTAPAAAPAPAPAAATSSSSAAAAAAGLRPTPSTETPPASSSSRGAEGQDASHATSSQSDSSCALSSYSLPADVVAELQRHSLTPYQVTVPKNAPQTRQQWEQWGAQYWPMGWKVPDSRMAAAAERVVATREEQAYFEAHMARVLQACAGNCGSTSPCNAAHIVEPNTGLVVGKGTDCRHSHPLHHAVMAAIAGAAAWDRQQWPTVPSVCAMPEAGSEEHEQGAGFSGGPGAMQQQQLQQHCTNGNPQAAHQASAPTGPEGRPGSCTGHVLRCAADEGVVPKRQRTNDSSDGPCCLPRPYPQQQQPYNFQRTDDSSDRPSCLPPPHPQQQQHSNFQQQTQDGSHRPCCLPPPHPQQQQRPYNFQQRTDDSSDRPCCLPPPYSQQQKPSTTFQQPCTSFQQWTWDSPDRPSCLPPPHPQQQQSTTFQQQPEPAPLQQRSGHVVEQKGGTHHLQQELHQQGCSGQLPQGPQGHNASIAAALGLPRPYMCTGYDCFIAREPCVMCAMALVHSRVARVVFCHPDADGGALGGRLQLMGQRSLNHHYKVYRLGLAPDAQT